MILDVHLLDRATDQRAVYDHGEDTLFASDPETFDYLWSEGNFGCDCNRHDFFCQATGREPDHACPCNMCDDQRYVIEKITERGTDRVLYTDAEGVMR